MGYISFHYLGNSLKIKIEHKIKNKIYQNGQYNRLQKKCPVTADNWTTS